MKVSGGRIVSFAAVLVFAAGAIGCSGDDDSGSDGGSSSDESAPQADPEAGRWVHLGRDLANSRAALDETIGVDNVASLEPAWELDGVMGMSGTPVVDDGTVYVGTWDGHARALDAETGEVLWDRDLDSYYIAGAFALDDERVYVATFDTRIVALDRESGEPVWETKADDQPQGAFFGSPILVDGMVIIGGAGFEDFIDMDGVPNTRGFVVALDAETGEETWRFWTTAGDATEGPGVPVWGTVTVDEERGHVYVPTGNVYALPDSPRADAIIALDLATGEQIWVRQFTAGDAWTIATFNGPDADVGAPPNLIEVNGTPALGVGDKAGDYIALDRDTGEVLWKTKLTEGGLQGGVLASAAVADGIVYVASNVASQEATLLALEVDTGAIVWQVDTGAHASGPVTWANGVVYLEDDSGKLVAYDDADGAVLWSYDFGEISAAGVAVVDGTVYAGWGYWALTPSEDPQGGFVAFRPTGDGSGSGGGDAEDDEDEALSGEEIYEQRCASCHGGGGEGGSGVALEGVADRLSRDEQIDIVTNGRDDMPEWGDNLSPEEIEAVVDYTRDVLSGGSG